MDCPTPTVHIDLRQVRTNIQKMAAYAKQHGLALRPHTKTHKSLRIGRMQMEAGAMGLTVAKVGEAEVMREVCDDLLLAYPTIDMTRCRRAAQIAADGTRLRVGLDSSLAAERLSSAADEVHTTVGLLVEYDLGYGRTGVQTMDEAIELGKQITQLPGLRLDGIMTYTGHIGGSPEAQTAQFAAVAEKLEKLFEGWDGAGLCRDIVSGGSTPAAYHCHLAKHFTEVRPGTYVYNDMNIVHGGYGAQSECAAKIRATVVSATVPGQVVLDSGSKTLTSDLCGPAPETGHGYICEYPDAKIKKLTEEHAQVDVTDCPTPPKLGEQVTIIPNHICVCINMQDQVYLHDGDQTEVIPIDTRGKLV